MTRRLQGPTGERWDGRRLRRVREDGWFRQHEPEMIEAARRRVARAGASANPPAADDRDAARRAAAGIIARATRLIQDIDQSAPSTSR